MMGRRRNRELSERQRRVMEVLEEFQDQFGYPPSIREICDKAKISSTSVVDYYLKQLETMGYIQRAGGISRGIRLITPLSEVGANSIKQNASRTTKALADLFLKVPMAGRIQAGLPIPIPPSDFSYYDPESMVDVAISQLPNRERDSQDLYALEVQGESMVDALINDGDIVIMKPAEAANNGEMVAIWLDDRNETTLKYFYLDTAKKRVRLQPANPTMGPIYIDNPDIVQIQGKVVSVMRKVN